MTAKGYPEIIKPCPKCKSENITLYGMPWIQVHCLDCDTLGPAHSYGTRLDRYCEAITSWNALSTSEERDA